MAPIAGNNVRRRGDYRALQDLVVVGIGGNYLKLTGDRYDPKKCEEIDDGIERLLWRKMELGLQLL
jgi:hypothetical protein